MGRASEAMFWILWMVGVGVAVWVWMVRRSARPHVAEPESVAVEASDSNRLQLRAEALLATPTWQTISKDGGYHFQTTTVPGKTNPQRKAYRLDLEQDGTLEELMTVLRDSNQWSKIDSALAKLVPSRNHANTYQMQTRRVGPVGPRVLRVENVEVELGPQHVLVGFCDALRHDFAKVSMTEASVWIDASVVEQISERKCRVTMLLSIELHLWVAVPDALVRFQLNDRIRHLKRLYEVGTAPIPTTPLFDLEAPSKSLYDLYRDQASWAFASHQNDVYLCEPNTKDRVGVKASMYVQASPALCANVLWNDAMRFELFPWVEQSVTATGSTANQRVSDDHLCFGTAWTGSDQQTIDLRLQHRRCRTKAGAVLITQSTEASTATKAQMLCGWIIEAATPRMCHVTWVLQLRFDGMNRSVVQASLTQSATHALQTVHTVFPTN